MGEGITGTGQCRLGVDVDAKDRVACDKLSGKRAMEAVAKEVCGDATPNPFDYKRSDISLIDSYGGKVAPDIFTTTFTVTDVEGVRKRWCPNEEGAPVHFKGYKKTVTVLRGAMRLDRPSPLKYEQSIEFPPNSDPRLSCACTHGAFYLFAEPPRGITKRRTVNCAPGKVEYLYLGGKDFVPGKWIISTRPFLSGSELPMLFTVEAGIRTATDK